MLDLAKTMDFIIKCTPLLCGLVFVATIALLPISVRAQCSTRWDASGEWSIMQRGQQ